MTDSSTNPINLPEAVSSPGDILIVDDTPLNLRLLSQLLSKNGYHVRVATNGTQGLRSVELVAPELILLDVMMPDISGYDVCRRLKADPQTKAIPIIFISALDSADDKVQAFGVGGADYVTKPFQAAEVLARVKTQLDRTRADKSLKEARAEAEMRATEAETLRHAGAAVTATLNQDEAIDRILQQLALVVPHDMAVVELARGDALVVVGGRGKSISTAMLGQRVPYNTDIPDYQVWNTRQALVQHNPAETSSLYNAPYHEVIRSWLGVPLLVRDQCIGVVSLISMQPEHFTARHAELAAAFAVQVAIALENARAYTEIRLHAEELAIINRIGLAVTAGLDMQRLLQALFEQCRQLGAIDTFYVALYDESTGTVHMPFYYAGGELRPAYSRDLKAQPGLTGNVIQSRRALYLPDTLSPPAELAGVYVASGFLPETRSYIGVPLVLRDRVIGVLSMQSCNPDAYTPDQIRMLDTIAIQAAIAIENSRLYEQAQQEIASRALAEQSLRKANEHLLRQIDENEKLQHDLREQAIRDPLTRLFNRRYLEETLDRELSRSIREGSPLSVVLLDIDHFKAINDVHGHKAGDLMLQAISDVFMAYIRHQDVVCRYGGEEFVVVLPCAPLDAAARRAEQWRRAVESLRVAYGDSQLSATLSIGVAAYPIHGDSYDDVIRTADKAMYAAKTAGRNCIVIAPHTTIGERMA